MAGAGSLQAWTAYRPETAGESPTLVFGAVADVQYCDCAPWGRRRYRESASKLRSAMDVFSESGAEFAIQLGDLIEHSLESFETVLLPAETDDLPHLYHVLGNHDWAVDPAERASVLPTLGLEGQSYYSFSRTGWRFVVMDGTEISIYATEEDSEAHLAAEAMLDALRAEGMPNAQLRNGAVSIRQLEWLEGELGLAEALGERAIVFCHFPVYPPHGGHTLYNAANVRAVLERHRRVVAAHVSGHDHRGAMATDGGIHYLTLHGIVESGVLTTGAVFYLHRDRIEVHGLGRQPSYALPLSDTDSELRQSAGRERREEAGPRATPRAG